MQTNSNTNTTSNTTTNTNVNHNTSSSTNQKEKSTLSKSNLSLFRSYSFQPDEAYSFPINFVPDIKPKKHSSCTFSPLKLRDSYLFDHSGTQSDAEEQLKRFNTKRSHSKTINLSNASTSTDLPVIKLKTIPNEFYSKTDGNVTSSKSPLKKRKGKVAKKNSTILLGLRRKKNVEKLHL